MNKVDTYLMRHTIDEKKVFNLSLAWIEEDLICATDGRILLSVAKELSELTEYSEKHPTRKSVIHLLTDTKTNWCCASDFTPDSSQLELLQDKKNNCDECVGYGQVRCEYEHYHDCNDCDGQGFIIQKPTVKVKNMYFAWEYFKTILEIASEFSGGKFEWIQSNDKEGVSLFKCKPFEIWLMPHKAQYYEQGEEAFVDLNKQKG